MRMQSSSGSGLATIITPIKMTLLFWRRRRLNGNACILVFHVLSSFVGLMASVISAENPQTLCTILMKMGGHMNVKVSNLAMIPVALSLRVVPVIWTCTEQV